VETTAANPSPASPGTGSLPRPALPDRHEADYRDVIDLIRHDDPRTMGVGGSRYAHLAVRR